MANIIVYSSNACPYCDRAKELLIKKGLAFEEIRVDVYPQKRTEMIEITGKRTVPQIIINNQPIGGCDDLFALNHSGELDKILEG